MPCELARSGKPAEHREQQRHKTTGELPCVGGCIGGQEWIVHRVCPPNSAFVTRVIGIETTSPAVFS